MGVQGKLNSGKVSKKFPYRSSYRFSNVKRLVEDQTESSDVLIRVAMFMSIIDVSLGPPGGGMKIHDKIILL